MKAIDLRLEILPQPDDVTCGPACLHAVYAYYGDRLPLERVIREVIPLESRGTLAVFLALHALGRGYRATIYTYNLDLFDLAWFGDGGNELPERLRAQAGVKTEAKLRLATDAYLRYLAEGGRVVFEELTAGLIRSWLGRGRPILTGLSATYLYGCAREREGEGGRLVFDDVRGHPTGHFVVLRGFDPATDRVLVADPLRENPPYGSHLYSVGMEPLLGAILLGVLTYDANLLILEPAPPGARAGDARAAAEAEPAVTTAPGAAGSRP